MVNLIKFVYFDLGNVQLYFHRGPKALSELLSYPYEDCLNLWNSADEPLCSGRELPQSFWERVKNHTGYVGPDIDFVEFLIDHLDPIPETHQLVEKVISVYPVGLLTNIYTGVLPHAIKKGRVADLKYHTIIDSSEVGFVKPQPEIYALAEEKSGVLPSEIYYIDDIAVNIEAAKGRGWQTHLFNPENPTESITTICSDLNLQFSN